MEGASEATMQASLDNATATAAAPSLPPLPSQHQQQQQQQLQHQQQQSPQPQQAQPTAHGQPATAMQPAAALPVPPSRPASRLSGLRSGFLLPPQRSQSPLAQSASAAQESLSPSALRMRRWRENAANRAAEQRADTQRHRERRADPAVRAAEQERNTQQRRERRADPEVRAAEQQADTQRRRERRAADPAVRAAERERDAQRRRERRADPALRAAERERDAQRRRERRADAAVRAAEQEENTQQRQERRADPAVRAAEQQQRRERRANSAVRAAEQERNTQQRRERRANSAVRAAEQEEDTRRRQARRADSAVRAAEQQQQRERRADPEVRAAEQEANTQQRRERRADPAVLAEEARQRRDMRRAGRSRSAGGGGSSGDDSSGSSGSSTGDSSGSDDNPERQPRTRARRTAAPVNLLQSLEGLLQMEYQGPGASREPELPGFLMALPEGRVQDCPGGQLPADRQVPFKVQVDCAARMARSLADRMPSRVCAVCSCMCSVEESQACSWRSRGIELTRADITRTKLVERAGTTISWRRVSRMPDGSAPPPPPPALAFRYRRKRRGVGGGRGGGGGAQERSDGGSGSGGGSDGGGGSSSGRREDNAEEDDPSQPNSDLEELPPRPEVQPRPCADDPAMVEVAYCMRLERELPNRTMEVGAVAGNERFYVCKDCRKALDRGRVPEAALARMDPGDVPPVNHLGDPLLTPTYVESQLLGRARNVQQLLVLTLPNRPADVYPRAVRSHGVAVPNPEPEQLRSMLPARAADLDGLINVVCVDVARDREELCERVRKAPGLVVRGGVIVAWAQFLHHLDQTQLDEGVLREYRAMGWRPTVPEGIVRTAVASADQAVADLLRTTFTHARDGAAGIHAAQDAAEAAAHQTGAAAAAAAAAAGGAAADGAATGGHNAGEGRATAGRAQAAPPAAGVRQATPAVASQHVRRTLANSPVMRTSPWWMGPCRTWQELRSYVHDTALRAARRGEARATESWLYMPLAVDALRSDVAQQVFPFDRPPRWSLVVACVRTGCQLEGITAANLECDELAWHLSPAAQNELMQRVLRARLAPVLGALAHTVYTGQPWPDVLEVIRNAVEEPVVDEGDDDVQRAMELWAAVQAAVVAENAGAGAAEQPPNAAMEDAAAAEEPFGNAQQPPAAAMDDETDARQSPGGDAEQPSDEAMDDATAAMEPLGDVRQPSGRAMDDATAAAMEPPGVALTLAMCEVPHAPLPWLPPDDPWRHLADAARAV